MIITRSCKASLASNRSREPGAMMQDAMQPSLKATGSRLFISLNDSQRMFNLRRRRGFGSIHYGDARRSNRIPHTIRPWHGHHDPTWSTIPRWNLRDQRFGIVLNRLADDSAHRAAPTAPQLAILARGWLPGWLHDIFELRVGNAQPGKGRGPLAGFVEYYRKCISWVRGGLVGVDHRGETLIENT